MIPLPWAPTANEKGPRPRHGIWALIKKGFLELQSQPPEGKDWTLHLAVGAEATGEINVRVRANFRGDDAYVIRPPLPFLKLGGGG